jgi:hypothetical protein
MAISGAHGCRELASGLVGVDDVLNAKILEIRCLVGARAKDHDRGARRRHVAVLRGVTRYLTARGDAEDDDIGCLVSVGFGPGHIGPQNAHIALVPEQVGNHRTKRFVVTGHMYHDHDNSLSLAHPSSKQTLTLRSLRSRSEKVDELAAALVARAGHTQLRRELPELFDRPL